MTENPENRHQPHDPDDSEDTAEHSALGSLYYYAIYNRFPWESAEDEADRQTELQPVEKLESPLQLLRLLLSFIQRNGRVESFITQEENKTQQLLLPAPQPIELLELNDQQLLKEALAVAEVLFNTFATQNDAFYQAEPLAYEHWLRNVAHWLSKYRHYKPFLFLAETLIDRRVLKTDEDLGTPQTMVWYGPPHIRKEDEKMIIKRLRNSVPRISKHYILKSPT